LADSAASEKVNVAAGVSVLLVGEAVLVVAGLDDAETVGSEIDVFKTPEIAICFPHSSLTTIAHYFRQKPI
jgi:hypothetical protein